jgi:hypothetical protein
VFCIDCAFGEIIDECFIFLNRRKAPLEVVEDFNNLIVANMQKAEAKYGSTIIIVIFFQRLLRFFPHYQSQAA